jgi:hypothetical protein
MAASALLIELGLIVLVPSLLRGSRLVIVAALLIVAGLDTFVMQIRRAVAHRMPRPPALPARDWSTWQTHAALAWLLVAAASGVALAVGVPDRWRVAVGWTYGTAGLLGFLSQMITGVQGRLVPLYSWYRASVALAGPPPHGANELPSAAFARPIFIAWNVGAVGLLTGFVLQRPAIVAASAAVLLAGILIGAAYLRHLLRAARA